jgi:hypothetical protein
LVTGGNADFAASQRKRKARGGGVAKQIDDLGHHVNGKSPA